MEEEKPKVVFTNQQVQEIIPHRYPFLLIDKVIEFEENVRIVAIKNVSINEPFFNGHFPGRPVMPGVLIMEALAQAGAILARRSSKGTSLDKVIMLAGLEDARWKKPVVPGDTLRLEVTFLKKKAILWILEGKAIVDGAIVATAKITAAEVA